MYYPFEITDNDIVRLDQIDAVDFFGKLLWAEASFAGVSQRLISAPQCINTSDGGLDARIKESVNPIRDDIIPKGVSGFQIKKSALIPQKCKEAIQDHSNPNVLAPAVSWLMEKGGTYVLVLFASISDTQIERRENALLEEFSRLGYTNAKIRIYTSTQLVGFTNRFPSVALSLKPNYQRCLDYETWGKNTDVCKPAEFVQDQERSKVITGLRETLRHSSDKCPVVRILGLSGLGKTRLVYEALSAPDIRNRVIFSYSESFSNSDLKFALQRDNQMSAIMVIDECDATDHDFLAKDFSSRGSRLALITISNDFTHTAYGQITLSPIDEGCIKTILRNENPGIPNETTDHITRFAEGYPKIAMLLSENIEANRGESPDDLLRINDDPLINRMIAGRLDPQSPAVRATRRALKGFSIFTKVGWKGNLNKEAKWVASKFGFVSNAEWDLFSQIVKEQRERGILQGDHYLYVTPFPLAVYLIHDWLEIQGDFLDLDDFFDEAPPDLLPRFKKRIPYIGRTAVGRRVVEKLLGDAGPFADGRLLKNESGAEFFLYLTEAAPEIALQRLNETIGGWDKEFLLKYTEGRQRIVWSLERIAVWSDLFQDAARLLLALGEAETEHVYSNNASGIFCELFAFGPAPVANTEASPDIRIPILAEAFRSESKEKKLLALRACKVGLRTNTYHRWLGVEFQGARPIANLWHPKTWGELSDAYRKIWSLVCEEIESDDNEIRNAALNVILRQTRGFIDNAILAPMVIETFERLSEIDWLDKRRLIETLEEIIHYDGKNIVPENLNRLINLRDQLVGDDFGGLLNRYVGMNPLEYRYGEEGNEEKKLNEILNDLARQAINSPKVFKPYIPWLLSADAANGYNFGYILGKADSNFSFLKSFLETARKEQTSTAFFVGGYLKRIYETKPNLWERIIFEVSEDPSLWKLLPEMVWRSGMTDNVAKKILGVAKNGGFKIEELRLFSYGGVIRSLSETVFQQWAKFLLKEPSEIGAEILLDLYIFYYVHKQKERAIPKKLTLNLLCHQVFFSSFDKIKRKQGVMYNWKEIALKLIKQHPDTAKTLRKVLVGSFGNENSIISSKYSMATEVLVKIAQENPSETWQGISKNLTLPYNERSFHLKDWLRGEKGWTKKPSGALWQFNPSDVWAWIDENIDERAKIAADFVPPFLLRPQDKTCYARELLVRYGERNDVGRILVANFLSEGWSGPQSLHYMKSIKELENFAKEETDLKVKRWINKHISRLKQMVEQAQIEEEREGR